jgi:hypothetical protein
MLVMAFRVSRGEHGTYCVACLIELGKEQANKLETRRMAIAERHLGGPS